MDKAIFHQPPQQRNTYKGKFHQQTIVTMWGQTFVITFTPDVATMGTMFVKTAIQNTCL